VTTRTASCRCGQLQATCQGEPVRISVCHCLDCQRRSGSAFSAQARWPDEQVALNGERQSWQHAGDSGNQATFFFCPTCGATVAFVIDALPGLTGVPLGAFADPAFPPPTFSMFENRKHPWVEITGDIVHD
jgi:hypothetical protein